jgi:hypothetical protein
MPLTRHMRRSHDRASRRQGCDRNGLGFGHQASDAEEFAKEGADAVITYLHNKGGAEETWRRVEAAGRRALVLRVDQRDPAQVSRLLPERLETATAGQDSPGNIHQK